MNLLKLHGSEKLMERSCVFVPSACCCINDKSSEGSDTLNPFNRAVLFHQQAEMHLE